MIEAIITTLIYCVLLAVVIYLVLWIIGSIANVQLPAKAVQLIWVAYALICILFIVRFLLPPLRLAGAMLPLPV